MSLIYFLLIISVLVFIHELGHYLVARWCGVRVTDFAVGFGPELVGYTDGAGTRWKVCAIPLGGYVRMAGDAETDGKAPSEPTPGTYAATTPWQRVAISFAGPAANLLLTFALLTGLFMASVPQPSISVASVAPNSPAAAAGMQAGDRLVSIGGVAIKTWQDLAPQLAAGQAVAVVVDRNGQTVTLSATPDANNRLGINLGTATVHGPGVGPLEASGMAIDRSVAITKLIFTTLGDLVANLAKGEVRSDQVGGPVAMAQGASQSADAGLWMFVFYMAMLSLNLGLMNLLPIPPLDGGHIVLNTLRGLKIPLPQKAETFLFILGALLLLGLMVYALGSDAVRVFNSL